MTLNQLRAFLLAHRLGTFTAVAAELAELGIEPDDGLLVLSREIAASGRSSARISGRTATAGMLARIGAFLVDIHGQSDHLSLLRPAEHLEILDRFAGTLPARGELAALVTELRALRARIADIDELARSVEIGLTDCVSHIRRHQDQFA